MALRAVLALSVLSLCSLCSLSLSFSRSFCEKKKDFGYLVLNCAMLFVMPCCAARLHRSQGWEGHLKKR